MKIKTDLYTKIVLTVLTIFVGMLVFKDINLVSKAQANELDLSALKIEDASDAEETTFYIYENAKLKNGFSTGSYSNAHIDKSDDFPQYIITTKRGSFYLSK